MEMREQQEWFTWDTLFFWEEWFCFASSARFPEMTVKQILNCCCCCWQLLRCVPAAMLQDGGNGGVTSPESRRLEGLEGGVGDGSEAQRCARHPGDVIETAWLLIAWGYMNGQAQVRGLVGIWRVIHISIIWPRNRMCRWTGTQSFMTKQKKKEWSDTFIYVMLPQHCKI